jgi:DNA-binding MarR family transcriptional regulator
MDTEGHSEADLHRRRARSREAIKDGLRQLRLELSLLNYRIGAHGGLRDVDLDCLDFIARYGPLSPGALARRTGLHPATLTGVLDRLERGGWLTRDRDPSDRRALVLRAVRDRGADLVRLYGGMNQAMDKLLAAYSEAELGLIAEFLERTATAGRGAKEGLASAPGKDGPRERALPAADAPDAPQESPQ